jgi:hypothetical protein
MYNKIQNYLCIKVITADLIYYTSGIYIASSSSFPLPEDGGSKNILGITCVYLCN